MKLPTEYSFIDTLINKWYHRIDILNTCDPIKGGYVDPDVKNQVHICTIAFDLTEVAEHQAISTFVHELQHIQQLQLTNDNNVIFGKNVLTSPDHVLYKYYDILFNPATDSWTRDTMIVNNQTVPEGCKGYRSVFEDINKVPMYLQIFVSSYSCESSMKQPPHPEEELAEARTAYEMNEAKLLRQDQYVVIHNGTVVTGNLDRHTYIKNHFDQ